MKFKLWDFEYEFDRDDAKIVIPIVLLLISLSVGLNAIWLLAAAVLYYLLLFFSGAVVSAVRALIAKRKVRCPRCHSRKIILQGYQGYKSDEHYAYYFCDSCKATSILTDGGMLEIE